MLRSTIGLLALLSFGALATNDEVVRAADEATTPQHWSRLPIWGDKAREYGAELPLPIGVTLLVNQISADYKAKDDFLLQVDGGVLGLIAPGDVTVPAEDVAITGEDRSIQLKVDAWILPFWNVYGIVGYVDGHKDITAKLDNVDGLDCGRLPCPDLTGVTLPIPIEYTANNWGLGTVLAGQVTVVDGWQPFIISAVGAMVNARTSTTDSLIKTRLGQLRVGQRFDVNGDKIAWFLGYQYQKIDQRITGTYDFRGTELAWLMEQVHFDVELTNQENHNMAVSMMYDFGPQDEWNLFVEYGFLNWDQLTIGIGRRF
ncbi:hypothetical protein KUV89_03840 [Marinobacter hydrocarbonoclasticus]|nr:hypothetical protein [Marinobacter nauticus]